MAVGSFGSLAQSKVVLGKDLAGRSKMTTAIEPTEAFPYTPPTEEIKIKACHHDSSRRHSIR